MEFNFTCIRDVTFGVLRTARDGEFCMGIYTASDRAPLPGIGDSPNGLHTDLKFQNQAIQCCLFEPREAKYGKAVGRKSCIRLHDYYALLMRFAHILAAISCEFSGIKRQASSMKQ